jgi:chorismate synthase
MGNSLGQRFRVTTFGESHGGAVGVVIDGCPAGYAIDLAKVQLALDRRRPGQSKWTSPRDEKDQIQCLSGLENGVTLGSPICLLVLNENQKPGDYDELSKVFRPSHADFTTFAKYGLRAKSGGGRASARETIGRVAAAAVAEQMLTVMLPEYASVCWVDQVQSIATGSIQSNLITRKDVDQNALRFPDNAKLPEVEELLKAIKTDGDSVGGVIAGVIRGIPPGLGEPVFDKLEAELAKAVMSLPACKGFEVGSGFAGTRLKGSEHNDAFVNKGGKIRTKTNRSGGIQGGISNGEAILFRAAFKPVATIFKKQQTVNEAGENLEMHLKRGRHDPCVLPRAVPMVEAMATLVIMDHLLRQEPFLKRRGPHAQSPD